MASNADPRHATPTGQLALFHTNPHPCGYWPQREARDLVVDPRDPLLAEAWPQLLAWGFRRSGELVYRPHCQGCRACVPVRIDVEAFASSRSQRRCLAMNAKVEARVLPAEPGEEHVALYREYLRARHPGGGMDTHGSNEFVQFLIGRWGQTRFLELREDGELLALAVTDVSEHALSAVYTCFRPDLASRGLGTLAILRQLAWANRDGLQYLYLGYWIEGHPKMDYKRRFAGLEKLGRSGWVRFDDGSQASADPD
jgi:arginine-tRNA-protein transferase